MTMFDFTKLSDEELAALIMQATALLDERRRAKSDAFTFTFQETSTARGNKPYVARLTWNMQENQIDRFFYNLPKVYGDREMTVSGRYQARAGDIIEIRTGSSSNRDTRAWHVVLQDGTQKQVTTIQDSLGKLRVEQYLRRELSLEALLEA